MNIVQEISATSGEGLLEGLEWIGNALKERKPIEVTKNDVELSKTGFAKVNKIKTPSLVIIILTDDIKAQL